MSVSQPLTFRSCICPEARSAHSIGGLSYRPEVNRILYPFRPDFEQADLARCQMKNGGTIVSFDVAGGQEAAFTLLCELRLIDISNNPGDAKSLSAIRPPPPTVSCRPRNAPTSASPTAFCGYRLGWRTSKTCRRIWTGRLPCPSQPDSRRCRRAHCDAPYVSSCLPGQSALTG